MLLKERRMRGLLLGVALAALCAGSAPAVAQTYVGNDFSAGTSLLTALQSDGYKDNVAPFVILQEYNPAGPATSGAIFTSSGTVTDVSYYGGFTGGGKYDFTVYALALDSSNAAQNEQTFTVVGDQTFSGTVSFQGVHNLAADFSVGGGTISPLPALVPFIRRRRTTRSAPTQPTRALPSPIPSPRSLRRRVKPSPSAPMATQTLRTTMARIQLAIRADRTGSASPTRRSANSISTAPRSVIRT